MEGVWKGHVMYPDSIGYTYIYNKGLFESGVGYNKSGIAYPFTHDRELPNYRDGQITFFKVFTNHLKLPKNLNGKSASLEDVKISFVIEKDGHLDQFKVLGDVTLELNNALINAMIKCRDWTPGKYYGIPYRTKITLPLTFLQGYTDNNLRGLYAGGIFFSEEILGF